MKKYKRNITEKTALFEMATLTKGDLKGLEVVVYPSDHSQTIYPNFHLKGEGYEAEFKIPDTIPSSPDELIFLGYKLHKMDYSLNDLRRLIKWMPQMNKRIEGNTNFQAVRNAWRILNPDDKRI